MSGLTQPALLAGQLRDKIVFQVATETSDGAGGTTRAWSDVATRRALIEPMNGGEAFRAGVTRSTQFYRVSVRWFDGITPKHRILWGTVPLDIRTCADPDGTRRVLLITAESGAVSA